MRLEGQGFDMVIDAAVTFIAGLQRRRRVARVTAWTLVAITLIAPSLAPSLLGHSIYLLGVVAVVAAAGLTDFATSVIAAAVALLAALAMELRLRSPPMDIGVRATLFVAMTLLTAMGAEAFRRFQGDATRVLAELRTSEALTRTILETGPDAMLVIDVHGRVSRFSPAGEALFGWSAEEVIGRNVSMLMPAPYHSEHDGYISRYLRTGERRIIGQSREVTGRKRDGTEFPMMLHVGEVRVGDDRYFTGFLHDLTELHAANQRTQDLRAQLAHIWSMTSLGEMAAVLAHELNQPLAAITNYLRGARNVTARLELENDDLLEALDKAGDQAIRAGEIIRRMRNMVTRNAADPTPESLSDLIREIDFMSNLIAREGGATLRYDLAEGPDEVLADRIQVQQVTTNLVRNAVEAMRHMGSRLLVVSTVRKGPWWIVRVEDSGPGIPPGAAERLFEPLLSEKVQGMGLGLSISRAIIEGHSGSIWVEDSLLGGAAFCFKLPAASF